MQLIIKFSSTITFVIILALSASIVQAVENEIKSSFIKFINTKRTKLKPDEGIVCTDPGNEPKHPDCYNEYGKAKCGGVSGSVSNIPEGAGKPKQQKKKKKKKKKKRQLFSDDNGRRLKSRHKCPRPCGCYLATPPAINGNSIVKVHTSKSTKWEDIKKQLIQWQVPQSMMENYEMATMVDKAQFVNFDFYVQKDKNSATYEMAMGAARKFQGQVEIGYLYTGKVSATVSPAYGCGWTKTKKGKYIFFPTIHTYLLTYILADIHTCLHTYKRRSFWERGKEEETLSYNWNLTGKNRYGKKSIGIFCI